MLGSEKQADEVIGMEDVDYVLWGVGNHSGGPSRKDLKDIAAFQFFKYRTGVAGKDYIKISPWMIFL